MDPTPAQTALLARHAGASRFAYNQCLHLITAALQANVSKSSMPIPWSGFDLINAFNAWKKSEEAGRLFVVAPDGTSAKQVTGLAWRHEVSAQVFEEAAVDLGRALAAYAQARVGKRKGGRVGFPRAKRRAAVATASGCATSGARAANAVFGLARAILASVTLPAIGTVRVHDDTRRLRRLLRAVEHLDPDTGQRMIGPRAKILSAPMTAMGSSGWTVA